MKRVLLSSFLVYSVFSEELDLYETGDIPLSWRGQVSNDLCDFVGAWRVIPSESDSIDEIMRALGFGWFKRRALRNYASITTINVPALKCSPHTDADDEIPTQVNETSLMESPSTETSLMETSSIVMTTLREIPSDAEVEMVTYFPLDHVKAGTIPLHGVEFEYSDVDTGSWTSTADFIDGRLLQRRESEEFGVMWDTRVVFKHKPNTEAEAEASLNETLSLNESPSLNQTSPSVLPAAEDTMLTATVMARDPPQPLGPARMLFRWTFMPNDGSGRVLIADRWSSRGPPKYSETETQSETDPETTEFL